MMASNRYQRLGNFLARFKSAMKNKDVKQQLEAGNYDVIHRINAKIDELRERMLESEEVVSLFADERFLKFVDLWESEATKGDEKWAAAAIRRETGDMTILPMATLRLMFDGLRETIKVGQNDLARAKRYMAEYEKRSAEIEAAVKEMTDQRKGV